MSHFMAIGLYTLFIKSISTQIYQKITPFSLMLLYFFPQLTYSEKQGFNFFPFYPKLIVPLVSSSFSCSNKEPHITVAYNVSV